jgi:hypothetical protein
MKDNKSAFPVFDSSIGVMEYQCIDPGMDLKEYAAIKLKVPRSGDPELDAMIRESRRAEYIRAAFEGMIADEGESPPWIPGEVAKRVIEFADAMIAEMEKEAGK